jgi:RNA polymerase sigma-70 factor (ECF subfamily)
VLDQVALIESSVAVKDDASDVLESLVREHARFVFKVAYSVLRNHHDAEDATQETFLRVMRHHRELEGVRDVRAWLARICWRVAVDRRRNLPECLNEADLATTLDEMRSHEAGTERQVMGTQTLAMTERLIAGLPTELHDVLTLSTVEDMTSAEIASVLGIPDSSVRTRLFRARQLLKEKLAALLEGKAL